MPVMDGYQAAKLMRAYYTNKSLPQPIILAITGHSEEPFISRALNSGMDCLVPKPISAPILREWVNKAEQVVKERKYEESAQNGENYLLKLANLPPSLIKK